MTWSSSTNKLQGETEKGKRETNRLKDTKDFNHPDVKVLGTGGDDGGECYYCHWTVHLKLVKITTFIYILPQ